MKFHVAGISCGHCRTAITDSIRGIDPAAEVVVSIADRSVTVAGQLTGEQVHRAIEDAGYEATPIIDADVAAEAAVGSDCCGHCHA